MGYIGTGLALCIASQCTNHTGLALCIDTSLLLLLYDFKAEIYGTGSRSCYSVLVLVLVIVYWN